jgi:sugar phosphate isomerase/epimerase
MQISIAGYSFHGALAEGTMDVFGYLEACRYRDQLDTADLWNGVLGQQPDVYLQPEFLRQVKAALHERGLTLVNYHADGCHVWEADADKRAQHAALAERHLAAAEFLGAKTVRIDTGGADRHWTAEQFDFIAARYRQWAQRAHNAGYAIGPETHWGADNHMDNQLALAKAVATPGYGILLHMGKDVDGTPDDYDRALAPYAVHTHLDQRTTYNRIDAALGHLVAAGYRGCLGVEHHSAKYELAEVAAQLALVRRAVAKLPTA